MGRVNEIRTTSQLTPDLSQRIQTNQKFGSADLKSWFLEKLALRPGERLLDIGCGTGIYLISFAKQIKTDGACTGVDLSESSIEKARQACAHEKLKVNLFVESMDELKQCKKAGPFNTITFAYSAYYSKNPDQMFAGLLGSLQPEGRLVILGPYLDNNQEWFEFLSQFMTLPQHAQESSGTFMGNIALPFALKNFDEIQCFRFVNHITIPNVTELQKYWEANTYFDPKHDESFRKFSQQHFIKHENFSFRKAALLLIMKRKRSQ